MTIFCIHIFNIEQFSLNQLGKFCETISIFPHDNDINIYHFMDTCATDKVYLEENHNFVCFEIDDMYCIIRFVSIVSNQSKTIYSQVYHDKH